MSQVDTSLSRKAKDVAAGFVGGAVQVLVGQPFDLIKVRLQTGQFKTPLEAFAQTLKNEGPRAFYKGTVAPLFGVGACVSVQFYAFHEAKRRFQIANRSTDISLGQVYACGAVAGIANSIITSPVEQIRILLQTQKDSHRLYKGPRDAVAKIYQSHGLKGIFRGLGITVLREAQAYGVWFCTFEYLMSTQPDRKEVPTWKLMTFGALAGEALWLASYPLDVIKTRIHSSSFDRNESIAQAAREIGQHGFVGFWRGIAPTLLRALPASACTFASVELTLRLLG